MTERELFPPEVSWTQVADAIVACPAAVYGYAPRPGNASIGFHAAWAWEDPAFVAQARAVRLRYRRMLVELACQAEELYRAGSSDEAVARLVSQRRNALRVASYGGDTAALACFQENNVQRYGTAEGLTPEAALEKYGTWRKVVEKSFHVNLGMDVCCGLCQVTGH